MQFDPDEYLASSPEGDFDPDAYLSEPAQNTSLASKANSALRGSSQGVSMGFDDEIAGALSVAGRPFGIKGLGGKLSDIELASPTLDAGEIMGEYDRVRDAERANNAMAEKENPNTYFGSQIAGGVGGSLLVPGLNAAKGAGLMATAGKAGLQGALTGAGMSEADNLGGLAKDVGFGTGLGVLAGTGAYGAGKAIEKASPYIASGLGKVKDFGGRMLPKFGKVVADIPEEFTDEYLKRGGDISARTESEILDDLTTRFGDAESQLLKAKDAALAQKDSLKEAKNLAMQKLQDEKFRLSQSRGDAKEAVNQRFSQLKEYLGSEDITKYKQAVLDDVSTLKNMVSKGSKESYDILDNDAGAYSVRGAAPILRQAADDMNIQPYQSNAPVPKGFRSGDATNASAPITNQSIGVQNELRTFAKLLENTPEKVPARELKKMLQQIDNSEKAMYGQPGFDGRVSAAYKMVRNKIDEAVKAQNPEYASKMLEVADNTALLNETIERFGSESKAISRLKGIGSEQGRDIDFRLLKQLGSKTGFDYEAPINKYLQNQDTLSSPQALNSLKEGLPEFQKFKSIDDELTGLIDPRTARSIDDLPEVAGAAQGLKQSEDALAAASKNYDVFAPVKPASAQGKLRALTGARDYNPKQIFENIDNATGQNFSGEIKDRAILDSFEKSSTNGSRKTLFGSGLGAAVGGMVAGPLGATAGGSIGGATGFVADKYAGKMFKAMLDGSIGADKALQVLGPKLGKYATVLQQAAQRGPQGLASTHFLLQQTEPNYRMILDQVANNEGE